MKRFLLLGIMIWGCFSAKAQIWYYIPAGESTETFSGMVFIVIKDNNDVLWHRDEYMNNFKKNLLKDNDYYINTFNKSDYATYGGTTLFGNFPKGVNYNVRSFSSVSFNKLLWEQTTSKCYVYKDAHVPSIKYAFSLDFNTVVHNPEEVNPSYYISCPVEKFIVRRSIDDLF